MGTTDLNWAKACELAGFKAGPSTAQIKATVDPLAGPEKLAVRTLLHEALALCMFGQVDEAAEHLRLAGALLSQAGRVVEALQFMQGVEDAICGERIRPIEAQHEDVAEMFVQCYPQKGLDELLTYYAPEDRACARAHLVDAIHRIRGSR